MNLLDLFSFIIAHIDKLLYVTIAVFALASFGWFVINQSKDPVIQTIEGPEADDVRHIGEELIGTDWLYSHDFQWVGSFLSPLKIADANNYFHYMEAA